MKRFSLLLLAAALAAMGCDSSSKKTDTNSASGNGGSDKKGSEAAADNETGRYALYKMLPVAHIWAADVKPVRLESAVLGGSDGHDGKASFWRATFGTAARQKAETFTWSGIDSPDTPKGVNHGPEDSYNPANRSAQGFDLAFLKIDTDEAFKVAQEHGGKQLLAKNPRQEVMYLLDWDSRDSSLNWHVIYGSSPSSAKLSVIVNASDGNFVHKE